MSIYDKLIGCIPVNKIAGCVVSLHPEDFQQTGVEERIKQLGEEMFMINSVKGLLPSSVSTSLHHNIEKKPIPMPRHCCTGMTMDEWADVKNKEHTTTVMPMPIVVK